MRQNGLAPRPAARSESVRLPSHAVGRQPLDGQARRQQGGGESVQLVRNSASFVCVFLFDSAGPTQLKALARQAREQCVCRARSLDFGFVLVALLLLLLLILAADSNPGVHPCWALLFQTQFSQPLLSRPARLSRSQFFFYLSDIRVQAGGPAVRQSTLSGLG